MVFGQTDGTIFIDQFDKREVDSRSSLFTESYVYLPGALFVIVMVWATQAELPVNNPW